jgi:signal recognition particle receptor subunit beta
MVVDSTDRERLDLAKQELHKMAKDDSLQSVPMLVMANKQDVRG